MWTQIQTVSDSSGTGPKKATRLIPGLRCLTYAGRSKHLKFPLLVYCRRRGDMIHAFKIHKAFDRIDALISREHNQTNVCKNCCSIRETDDWKRLPDSIIESNIITSNEF